MKPRRPRGPIPKSFTPQGANRAVTLKLAISFVGTGKAKAAAARAASAAKPRIDASNRAGPALPDGRLHGAPSSQLALR